MKISSIRKLFGRLIRPFRAAPPVAARWTRTRDRLEPTPRNLLDEFLGTVRSIPGPRVLELGTRRWPGAAGSIRRSWIPDAREYHGTDQEAGDDVDLVADVHRLAGVVGTERYEVVIACSVFEHIKYPHLAAHEVMKVLTVGGHLFLQTHQSFPLHAFPHDYYRFSEESLRALFTGTMGIEVLATDYEFPCGIHVREIPEAHYQPAFLNVRLWARKKEPTPALLTYEL